MSVSAPMPAHLAKIRIFLQVNAHWLNNSLLYVLISIDSKYRLSLIFSFAYAGLCRDVRKLYLLMLKSDLQVTEERNAIFAKTHCILAKIALHSCEDCSPMF